MADAPQTPPAGGVPVVARAKNPPGFRQQQLNKLYALPAPLRTFPLPAFVPHNPLSLFHILFVWLSHTIRPPSSHFDELYQGLFSPGTRSIHVTDNRSIRGLWEQGFYGKGTLSRSEPSWLDREKARRGDKTKSTSEEMTKKRRAERQQTKWERARKERELIDQTLLEEAAALAGRQKDIVPEIPAHTMNTIDIRELRKSPEPLPATANGNKAAPVGPLEILALPNPLAELQASTNESVLCFVDDFDQKYIHRFYASPVGPLELLALPNSLRMYPPNRDSYTCLEASADPPANQQVDSETLEGANTGLLANTTAKTTLRLEKDPQKDDVELVGGSETNEDTLDESTHSEETTETNETPPNGFAQSNGSPITPKIKRQKSVRFSPTVEKTTFLQSEPPSPERASIGSSFVEEAPLAIQNQEHLQLTLEEAFFLSYALGAISIHDTETKAPLSNQDLFYLFRKTSYFPPRPNPSLSPDDSFMINYVVYHHYRSLGWIVRSGIKFSVDYMLYNRGPVFSHAEFGVVVLPSYSDPYWTSDPFLEKYSREKQQRTWAWMSCINRVITQVKKTLISTYVDIPPPLSAQEEEDLGIDGVLARYKVREFVMKRFAANRMRD